MSEQAVIDRVAEREKSKAAPTSPVPWSVAEAWGADKGKDVPLHLCFHEIRDAEGNTVLSTWARPHLANAELVCAAVNSRIDLARLKDRIEALLEALKEAADYIKDLDGGDRHSETGWKSDELLGVWLKARAAIAKAEGHRP